MRTGVLLLCLAMGLTPGVDALVKILTGATAPFTVTFLRFLSAGCIALVAARALGLDVRGPSTLGPGQLMRTALMAGATVCLVFALKLVPLACAVGGFLVSPIVSTLLGVVVLGERLTPNRAAGSALSLIGACAIAQPAASLSLGAVSAILGGTLLGLYLVATRAVRARPEHPLVTLAVQCLLAAAMTAPLAATEGVPVLDAATIATVLALGAMAATSHLLIVAAYRRADTAVLAPFMYFNLIAALATGYLVFGEVPEGSALFGLLAIGGGGVLATLSPTRAFTAARNRVAVAAR